ncbi:MAG: hypothetical protein HRT45_15810 [Bdellovibrionales bacterium]|nr:hypothetical protein [Bdellovibrionales bacterium]
MSSIAEEPATGNFMLDPIACEIPFPIDRELERECEELEEQRQQEAEQRRGQEPADPQFPEGATVACVVGAMQAKICCETPDECPGEVDTGSERVPDEDRVVEGLETQVASLPESSVEQTDVVVETEVAVSNYRAREANMCSFAMNLCNEKCAGLGSQAEPYCETGAAEPSDTELSKYAECRDYEARKYRHAANQTISCSMSLREQGAARPGIVCYRNSAGLEQCEYMASRVTSFADLTDPLQAARVDQESLHPYGALTMGGDTNNPHCSGTPVGDGSHVWTAAHCLVPGNQTQFVTEVNGRRVLSEMDCADRTLGYSLTNYDFALCRLSNPVPMDQPTFVLTENRSLRGYECIPNGFYLECSHNYIRRLEGTNAQIVAFPGSQRSPAGGYTPIYTQTPIQFNRSEGGFYARSLADPGSSGAGWIVDIDGRRVLVGNSVFAAPSSGGGWTHEIRNWTAHSLQGRLNERRMENGRSIFE